MQKIKDVKRKISVYLYNRKKKKCELRDLTQRQYKKYSKKGVVISKYEPTCETFLIDTDNKYLLDNYDRHGRSKNNEYHNGL